MCLLYLVALLIIFLMLWKLLDKKNKNINKIIENNGDIPNTESFTNPQNKFLKALNDIKN